MFAVELTFSTDLAFFLRREWRGPGQTVRRTLTEKTAVKDVIEACGVPHPEVDLIVVAGDGQGRENPRVVDFTWQVQVPVRLQISMAYPLPRKLCPKPHGCKAARPRVSWPMDIGFKRRGHPVGSRWTSGLETTLWRAAAPRPARSTFAGWQWLWPRLWPRAQTSPLRNGARHR